MFVPLVLRIRGSSNGEAEACFEEENKIETEVVFLFMYGADGRGEKEKNSLGTTTKSFVLNLFLWVYGGFIFVVKS